jgi:hypothetical protein
LEAKIWPLAVRVAYPAETGMTDEITMRARLQNVAAYRELCRAVRKSGRENVVYALVMLGLAYFIHTQGGAPPFLVILYFALAAGEMLVGLFKWLVPSAEGLILDGLVLLTFAVFNLGMAYLQLQNGGGVSPVGVFFGLFMLMGAINRFKYYGQLRKLFADRPAPEHVAWFDDLVLEIKAADPHTDPLAIDLPTRPHWKAKLLGSIAFFVSNAGAVWLIGPDDFALKREKADHGTGYRKAILSIGSERFPEFEIDDASWANYQKWMVSHRPPQPPA